MAEHIDEIKHHHVQLVFPQLLPLLHETVGIGRTIDLMIRERLFPAIALHLCLDKRLLVQVLAFFLVLVDPQLGEHLRNLVGHESAEDGVTGILGGSRQDAAVEVFVDVELIAQFSGEHAPLVVTEIIEHHEEHFLTTAEQREHLGLKHLWRQHRTVDGLLTACIGGRERGHPLEIVLLDELGKSVVCFFLLHGQHISHTAVCTAQFQFPVHEATIHISPVFPFATILNLHGYLLETLLVLALCHLCLYLPSVDVLLQCQQNLVGVDGFDQVIGNLLSDGLLHDVFLLALGHHHHRQRRLQLLDALQRFQSTQAWHLFVEQYKVEIVFTTLVDGIRTIRHRHHLIAFLLQEQQVSPQLLHLVIHPQQ